MEDRALGYFDAALAPAITVPNCDIVRVEALTHRAGDAPELIIDSDMKEVARMRWA